MTAESTKVLVVLNEAGEASIPLEIAAGIDEPDLAIDVCAFFEPDDETFGVDIHWLGARSQLDPRAYVRLVKLVRRLDPDVVHVHPNGTGSVVRLLLALTDVALVTTEHNAHDHFGRVKRVLNGVTNALNDVVIANSEATERSFTRWERWLLSRTDTPVRVIHNGVDLDRIEREGDSGDAPTLPDGFLIGTAGRLVPQKNQDALIRAGAPLIEDHDDVHLVFVGSGPLESDLRELATALGVDENTHFLGYLPKRSDVYAVMAELDVFAFPSRYEGFGVAVAEAMALERPVIANDIPVFREVVGDAGVLVGVDDEEAVTYAVRSLYEDEARRRTLGKRAANRVSNRFSLERTVRDHVRLYHELAG